MLFIVPTFLTGKMSTVIGWVIQQGKIFDSQHGREEVMGIKETLKGVTSGRNCQNRAILLVFMKKVSLATASPCSGMSMYSPPTYCSCCVGQDQACV